MLVTSSRLLPARPRQLKLAGTVTSVNRRLVLKSVDPPRPVFTEHPVLQAAWYPGFVIIERAVKEEGTRIACGKALHSTESLAFSRPAAVEMARLRKEIDIEFAATRVSEKMPSVRWERVFSKNLPDRFLDSGETPNARTISLHELWN